MERVRGGLGLGLILACLLLGACDDDDDGNGGGGGGGDTGGGDGGGGDGGGGSDVPDQEACETVNTQCRTPLPSAGVEPRVLFEQIQFGAVDRVVLKNVSQDAVDISGYFLCRNPTYDSLPAITLDPSGEITLHLGESGTDTDTDFFYPDWPALSAADELAIFDSDDFENSASLVTYVRWGNAASGFTREPQAVGAGYWTTGDFVPVCGDNAGIVAVGDATLPRGFIDVPASCFQ